MYRVLAGVEKILEHMAAKVVVDPEPPILIETEVVKKPEPIVVKASERRVRNERVRSRRAS